MYDGEIGTFAWRRERTRVHFPFDALLKQKATMRGPLIESFAAQLGVKYRQDRGRCTDQFLDALWHEVVEADDNKMADRDHADVILRNALLPAEHDDVLEIAHDLGLANTEVVTTIDQDAAESAMKDALAGALTDALGIFLTKAKRRRHATKAA